jgi:hypothetical protein
MSVLMTLITICKVALEAGNKTVNTLRRRRLTKEEKELLVAASQEMGAFHVCSVDAIPGGWVRAGSRNFLDETNDAHNAKYLEAFRSLCERGYIEYRGGKLFVLNILGYERAERLTKG